MPDLAWRSTIPIGREKSWQGHTKLPHGGMGSRIAVQVQCLSAIEGSGRISDSSEEYARKRTKLCAFEQLV